MQLTQNLRFGSFQIDVQEHQLLRDGRPVAVTRKAFALLAALLSRPGKLLTKGELFDTVWTGTVVTDSALSRVIRELRIALSDDAGSPRFIATAHGVGFRFVAPVSVESPAPAPPSVLPTTTDDPCLVGRETETAGLEQALVSARAGRRQIVFVTGEAGIGKTALVEAFVARHGVSGWVAQGRCIEQYGTGEAYLPILEALERLAAQVGMQPFVQVFERYAPAWLVQLPWLARDADAATIARVLADASPQRMLREIAHALEILAAQNPIVLWLEDLHWSDPSSLAVLGFLAGRREPARLLIVGSLRPSKAQSSQSPLQGVMLRAVQRGQANELALGPLNAVSVADYLNLRFAAAADVPVRELGDFIHRRTDGNALFMIAMVNDLVRRRTLTKAHGDWSLVGSVADLGDRLPDSLRLLVHDDVEQLDESDRRLLEAAAIAGTDFSAAAVAAALQTDVGDVEERCAALARQGRFVRARSPVDWPDGSCSGGYGFLHALYWQGIHERVPHSRRAEWQRSIGLRQEQAYGADCVLIGAELAMRFEAARDIDRSLRYLQMAGTAALVRCAYPECIELLRHAVALVPQLAAEQRPRRELDLLLPLGAALMATQGYASASVESTYQRALTLCQLCAGPGDLERVLRGLWNVAFLRADLAGARRIAEQLLHQADQARDALLAFDAHTKLGEIGMHLGEWASARTHLERALSMTMNDDGGHDDSGRLRALPRVAAYLSWVLWVTGYPTQALHRGEQALTLAARGAGAHSTAFALGFVSWLHVFRGNLSRARELARQQQALCVEHGIAYWRVWAEFTLGIVSVREGHADEGLIVMRRAIETMQTAGANVGIPHFLCFLAEAELAAGNLDEARAALSRSARLVAGNGNAYQDAEAARLTGEIMLADPERPHARTLAAQRLQEALAVARSQGARSLELRAATSLAQLWTAGGYRERAIGLLAPIFDAFTEGSDTVDHARASDLLAESMLCRTA